MPKKLNLFGDFGQVCVAGPNQSRFYHRGHRRTRRKPSLPAQRSLLPAVIVSRIHSETLQSTLRPELDAANGFTVKSTLTIKAAPDAVYRQIIHIGDSYDLWVGCEPRYYKPGKPNVHDNLQLLEPGQGTWSCKASGCLGNHTAPDQKCMPGVWHCGRRRRTPSAIVQAVSPVTRLVPKEEWYVPFCFGHSDPDATCDTGEDYTWDCGRVSEGFLSLNGSSCTREHKSPGEACAGSGKCFRGSASILPARCCQSRNTGLSPKASPWRPPRAPARSSLTSTSA